MKTLDEIILSWEENINRCAVDYQEPEPNEHEDDYYYNNYYRTQLITVEEIERKLGKANKAPAEEAVLESRVQKAVRDVLKQQLEKTPSINTSFIAETPWKWLNQLLTAARIKELAQVRVVRKGRRSGMGYDITELVTSFYGKQILKNLNFNVSRKRVVNKEEFELIVSTCSKIKLKLPEVIQPTTTEKFFNPEVE